MSRIYVASSWRNPLHTELIRLLRGRQYDVFDYRNPPNGTPFKWEQIGLPNPCSNEQFVSTVLNSERAAHGFLSDFRGMQWADTCILIEPSGRSAHLELGWMAGRGKRTIVLADEYPDLMLLMADHLCVSIEEVLQVL